MTAVKEKRQKVQKSELDNFALFAFFLPAAPLLIAFSGNPGIQ
jgi:hypothetical protein